MPLFEYRCQECSRHFEFLVQRSTVPSCPLCQAEQLEKQLSGFAVNGSSQRVTPTSGGCGSCGDPRGPGACSMN
ncbi:MAG: zinc ribbon domain-containing protein [Nitrospirales bacterium]|nr:zinc ribbon domain-containing protein [Nitrospirales bacterium]